MKRPANSTTDRTPSATPKLLTRIKDYRPGPTGYKLFLEDGRPIFPLLLVDWYECEGPVVTAADLQDARRLFSGRYQQSSRECSAEGTAASGSQRMSVGLWLARATPARDGRDRSLSGSIRF
jgi:hypothetical protein